MKKTLNGANLKWIAIIAMLIDHIGAILILNYASSKGIILNTLPWQWTGNGVEIAYGVCRLIGRLAFPIFCFLITEGYYHTKNVRGYLVRLGIFALISEIPFDLASAGQLNFSYQNVFVTLFYGVLTIHLATLIIEKLGDKFWTRILQILVVLGLAYFNEIIGADYGMYGILFIFLIYIYRKDRNIQSMIIFFMGLYQMTASLSAILINKYNGQRGKQPKYFFYIFYPAHLLLLYFITDYMLKVI